MRPSRCEFYEPRSERSYSAPIVAIRSRCPLSHQQTVSPTHDLPPRPTDLRYTRSLPSVNKTVKKAPYSSNCADSFVSYLIRPMSRPARPQYMVIAPNWTNDIRTKTSSMSLRALLQFGCAVLATLITCPPAAAAVDEPAWIRSRWFAEQFFTSVEESRVRVHVNVPLVDGEPLPRATRLIIYALPNGNTIEQTLGCRLANGVDWHYDIQHVAAQVRLLRALQPNDRIVLICAKPAA